MLDSYFNYLESNRLIEPDIAIHCDTREKAEYLISMYAASGKAWSSTSPLIVNNNEYVTRWGKDKEATCYRVNESDYNFLFKSISSVYEKKGVIVLDFQELFPYIELTEQPVVEEETNKKKNKSKLFGKKKSFNNEDTSTDANDKSEINDTHIKNLSVPTNESNYAIDDENDSIRFNNEKINKNSIAQKADDENEIINVRKNEISKPDIKEQVIESSSKHNTSEEPKQDISAQPEKEKPSSNVKNKGDTVKNEFNSISLPIMKNFKINDVTYRLNDSLICEKYFGMYWYPILDIEKYISILNHLKSGDVKYVE